VTDGVLMACIRDLRKVLGDDPRAPQFIETVHKRGYRFIAPFTTAQPVPSSKLQVSSSKSELLKVLPDMPERIQQEITMLLTVGTSVMATKGSAAPEVERVYARVHALCRQVGETPQLLPALIGLQLFREVQGDLQTARELAEQCLSLAQRAQDADSLLWANFALGQTLFQFGDLGSARAHLEQGLAFYDPQKHFSPACHPLADVGAACLCWLAFVLWSLGYPDQAMARMGDAVTQARELAGPYSLAAVLSGAAVLRAFRKEERAALGHAEAAITLSTEQGFAQWSGFTTVLRGWALAEQGHCDEGIAQMRQGVAAYTATGAVLSQPYQLALLAAACGKVGRIEEGLSVLAEALAIVNKSGARFTEAELYRLKGELTLK